MHDCSCRLWKQYQCELRVVKATSKHQTRIRILIEMHSAVQECYHEKLINIVWNASSNNKNILPDHHKFHAVESDYTLEKFSIYNGSTCSMHPSPLAMPLISHLVQHYPASCLTHLFIHDQIWPNQRLVSCFQKIVFNWIYITYCIIIIITKAGIIVTLSRKNVAGVHYSHRNVTQMRRNTVPERSFTLLVSPY